MIFLDLHDFKFLVFSYTSGPSAPMTFYIPPLCWGSWAAPIEALLCVLSLDWARPQGTQRLAAMTALLK